MSNEKVVKMWEEFHSKDYNAFSGKFMEEIIYKRIFKYFRKQDKLLDIACGNGDCFDWLRYLINQYNGIDISQTVCDKLIDRWKIYFDYIFDNNQAYINQVKQCDGLGNLKFETNSLDVVFSSLAFQHMKKEVVEKYIEESKRVLKDDGMLIIHLTEWKNYNLKKNEDISNEYDGHSSGMFSHTPEYMIDVFAKNGFKYLKIITEKENEHLKKQNAEWHIMMVTNNKERIRNEDGVIMYEPL